ncbi:MAG: hypothetical protein WAT20_00750, partial [Ferruginibacter sp.]
MDSFLIKGHIVREAFKQKQLLLFSFTFLLLQKSNKKGARQSPPDRTGRDYIPFVGWFPDLAFVLLWL